MTATNPLTTEFFARFDALVARHPGQETWRGHHERWLAGARRATTTRRISTKGGYTNIPCGALVLAQRDEETGGWSIWGLNSNGTTHTIVGEDALVFRCETCDNSGMVRPRLDALVRMPCPAC